MTSNVMKVQELMMQKSKPPRRTEKILSRYGRIQTWHSSLFIHIDHNHGVSPERANLTTIRLEGEFTEPVRGISGFLFQLSPREKPLVSTFNVPNIGVFIAVKPEFQGVVYLAPDEFQQVLTIAASGRLNWCRVAFTPPFRRTSYIVSMDFTTSPPE